MQVYKAFFKVIYKNKIQILIYVGVFLYFAILLSKIAPNNSNTTFTDTKVNVAFINYDKDSKIIEGLKNYLNNNANLININNDTKSLQDALFFRKVEYIVKVPQGFTKGLLNGKDVQLEKTIVPNSTSGIYMDNILNKYLNTVKLYSNTLKGLSQEEIVAYVNKDMSQKTPVQLKSLIKENNEIISANYYFNYLSYSLFAILILGVCTVMMVFNDKDLKMRNLGSPLNLRSMNFQMILGHISYALLCWGVMVVAAFFLYRHFMFTMNGLLLLLNSLVFTLAILSISFLIGNIIKSRNAMSAAANVISLGTSFISGVFVPQELLSKSVINFASLTPTFWFVKSNNAIVSLSNFNRNNLIPIFTNMAIVMAFAAAILSVTLVVIKKKRMVV